MFCFLSLDNSTLIILESDLLESARPIGMDGDFCNFIVSIGITVVTLITPLIDVEMVNVFQSPVVYGFVNDIIIAASVKDNAVQTLHVPTESLTLLVVVETMSFNDSLAISHKMYMITLDFRMVFLITRITEFLKFLVIVSLFHLVSQLTKLLVVDGKVLNDVDELSLGEFY